MNDLRLRLLTLICERAYRQGDFTLSSGLKSSYYIDGKQVTLDAEGAWLTGKLLFELLPEGTQAVGGLTLGADPIATAVSVISYGEGRPIPAFIVRKQAKDHGANQQVEGPKLPPRSRVVIVEDVVTTGGSALQAVTAVEALGWQVAAILTVVDRQQGGAERYASQGYPFQALFTIPELQAHYSRTR
ncbi:orotate phosphoribosyltransferase [Anthocerotibacter panamensis]|uniref:orotate phosphoribosyltransferase n=1 Tax=Anthocerotibacter panamensis TaxID=2857077 RepID=UPI001C402C23|nr:orotate phosphoribosyltransferase [Anthocerotibacter panamensis]